MRSSVAGWLSSVGFVGLTALACGSTADDGSPLFDDGHGDGGAFSDANTDGAGAKPCTTSADCSGTECNLTTHTCGCGGQNVAAEAVPPNLLVVLDRSCSMTDSIGGGKNKWQAAVGALETLTTTYANRIRFGLTLFPDKESPSCSQAAIPIPVAPGNEGAVQTLLTKALKSSDALYPSGPCVTNIDTAMLQAKTEPAFADKSRQSFVALVTDGAQSDCSAGGGDTGTIQAVKDLATSGVRTFVVGFGSGVDTKLLDSCADAGGEARVGAPHKYFDAADQASLDAALQAIANATLSCDLKLATPPPGGDANLVFVFFDGAPPAVPRDTTHADGWDYDAPTQTVKFYGPTCEKVKSGAVKKESVVFGCTGGGTPDIPR